MKRTISLWLGLLAFALLPALAQPTEPTGKIHGHVTNPTGVSTSRGSVSLSTDGGHTSKYTFQIFGQRRLHRRCSTGHIYCCFPSARYTARQDGGLD